MNTQQMSGMMSGMMQMMMIMMPMGMMGGAMSPMYAKSNSDSGRHWWVFWHKPDMSGRMPTVLSGAFTSEMKATRFVDDNEMMSSEYQYKVFSTKNNDALTALKIGAQKAGVTLPETA